MFSLALALLLFVASGSEQPLVKNPGFELAPFLTGWETRAHTADPNGRAPTFRGVRSDAKEGNFSLAIESADEAEAEVSQRVYLPIGSLWEVKVWAKTEGLRAGDRTDGDQAMGGFIRIETLAGDVGTSTGSQETTPWHEEKAVFRVPSPGFVDLTLVVTRGGTGRVWFDDVRLEALPDATAEDVHITAEHTTKRPIDVMQQGQFIEILCNLIPSIIAQQVVATSFEEAPPCKFAYKKETDEPYRPWYPDGAVQVARYALDPADPFNGLRSQKIELPAERARAGISQDGFYLKQGVAYNLRLHMRSEGNVAVRAWLHLDYARVNPFNRRAM